MTGTVILINGPSSSGKSTLAAALRDLIAAERGELYGIVSIDDLMRISTGETIYEDDVYDITGDMAEEIADVLETSPGVIVDHVITSERIYSAFTDAVGSSRLFTVHVTCPPEELQRREKARGDRHEGSALASWQYLYPADGYDLTVDTGSMSPGQCACAIIDAAFPECHMDSIPEKQIVITGKNYYGRYTWTRRAARGIVTDGDLILISYEKTTGQWMIPGGGVDEGESWSGCCVREVAEETGYLIEPSHCVLELSEYYEDCRYITRYFMGTVTGQAERKLTEREILAGMEPRWFSISDALAEFSTHERYDGTDEMRRGLYQREYTALTELFCEEERNNE